MTSECDILVGGGGVAGLPAAVASARAGARTVLVEHEAFLGGTGVTALHRYICGLYHNGPEEPKETLNGGMVREIIDQLTGLAPTSRPLQMGRVWGFPFEPAHLRAVYASLAKGEPNLTVLPSSTVEAIQTENNQITAVSVRSATGLQQIKPRAVIDATGFGTIIRLSGAPYELTHESERQLSGCTLHLDGIEGDRQLLALKIAWKLGHLPPEENNKLVPFAGFAAGCGEHDGFCKFSIPLELARLGEEEIGKQLLRNHQLLVTLLPELRTSHVIGHSPFIMQREGIRLGGEWELDEPSVLQARKFHDGVARNAWPIEFWDPSHNTPQYSYPPDDDFYEIPRRCLHSRKIGNLYATGRCISASSRALASTRVMGTCMSLGEATGRIATLNL